MKKYLNSFKQGANLSSEGAMEIGEHFKNGASPKSLTGRNFMPFRIVCVFVLLIFIPLHICYAKKVKVKISGNTSDLVYIAVNNVILHTKLPATVKYEYGRKDLDTLKIYAENYKVKKLVVEQKKYVIDFEQTVRSDHEKFTFWNDVAKELIIRRPVDQVIPFIEKIHNDMGLTNEKRAEAYISLGEFAFDPDSYIVLFPSRFKYTDEWWAKSINDFKIWQTNKAFYLFQRGYALTDMPQESCVPIWLNMGDEMLNRQLNTESTYTKNFCINKAILYFEEAKKIDPTNDLVGKYTDVANKMKQENDKEIAAAKQAERAERAQLWQELGTSLVNLGAAVNNLNSNNSGTSSVSTNNSATSGRNTGTANTKSKADCGSAWRTDSRTYSNYESQLIRMRTYPEQYPNYASDYSSIQSKMRQIRQKWEARGCRITKSQYE
jgi:tetratricopeptide (TPR) repeat protein